MLKDLIVESQLLFIKMCFVAYLSFQDFHILTSLSNDLKQKLKDRSFVLL